MDWLIEIKDALEQEVFGQVASLLNLERGQRIGEFDDRGAAQPGCHEGVAPAATGVLRVRAQDAEVPERAARQCRVQGLVVGVDAGQRLRGELCGEPAVQWSVPG